MGCMEMGFQLHTIVIVFTGIFGSQDFSIIESCCVFFGLIYGPAFCRVKFKSQDKMD